MDLDSFVERYPRLYHMTERNAWPSIRDRGLLSTSAALDLLGITGRVRTELERSQRLCNHSIGNGNSAITLRDQKPMPPTQLTRCLQDGLTPAQWYRLINGKVFFWAREQRLHGLLNARSYRDFEHDVLVIDTAALMEKYEGSTWLCHMNSGNTFPVAQPRGRDTFRRIRDYPTKRNGSPEKEVVEVVVDYCVTDIRDYVTEVRVMKGATVLSRARINGKRGKTQSAPETSTRYSAGLA
jgi:hypothetical protein